MSQKSDTSAGKKIWDMAFPLLVMFICLLVVSLVTTAIYTFVNMDAFILGIPDLKSISGFTIFSDIAFYGVCFILLQKYYRLDNVRFGKDGNRWKIPYIILACVIIAAVSYGVSTLIEVLGMHEIFPAYSEAVDLSFSGVPIGLLFLVVVVLAPITEELVFRGIFYRRVRNYVGVKWAIVISALAFGIYHANMVQFIYATVIGIVLAIIYEKSGSLIVSIIAHMTINALSVLTGFV